MRLRLLLSLLVAGHAATALGEPAQIPERDTTAAALTDTLRGMRTALDPITVAGRGDTSGLAVRAGSGAVIDAAAIVAEAPVASLMELVQARVPGVSVFQTPGVPGAAAQIRIRGVHSVLGDGNVAVYVDGVPVDAEAVSLLDTGYLFRAGIAGIAPEDIESVEVLKGPAATLWQGPAAAGGAILVTTRKANPGARGFTQRIVLEHGPVDPGVELPANWAHCGDPYHSTLPICEGQPADMILSDRPLERYGILDGGTASTIHWSGLGSTNRFGVHGSLGWTRDDGVLPTTGFDRRSARIGLQLRAAEALDVEVGFGAIDVELDVPDSGNRETNLLSLLGTAPIAVGAWDDSLARSNVTGVLDIDQTIEARRYQPRVRLVHRATPWLTHSLLAGAGLARDEARRRHPGYFPDGALLIRAERNVDHYTIDYRTRVDGRQLGDGRHDLALYLGAQATWYRRFTSVRGGTEGEPGEFAPTRPYYLEEVRRERESVGIVADARYGFRDRLFAELGIRHDWLDDVDRGRLFSYRVAATLLAYEARGSGARLLGADVVRLRAAIGGSEHDTFLPLTEEPMREEEVGIDATFLDGRLGLALTAFRSTSSDVLLGEPASSPSWPGWGDRELLMSLGEIRNSGVEATLTADLCRASRAAWTTRLAISHLASELADAGFPATFLGGWQWLRAGDPVGSYFSRTIVDVDEATGYVVVTETEESIGSPIPAWEGSLETELSFWNRLRVRALLDGRAGFKVFNETALLRNHRIPNSELYARRDQLSAHERTLYFGSYRTSDTWSEISPMSMPFLYIQDGSFLRLREVAATLDLPRTWVARVGASAASVTLAGRNVALWSRYDGVDPEIVSWDSPFERTDIFSLPQTARWIVRLAMQF